MSITDAITPEQVDKSLAWVQASFVAAETMDNRHWITSFFHPDGAVVFSGQAPTKGHEAMISYFDYFNSKLTSLKHFADRVDVLPDRIYIQARVQFVVKNDPEQKAITLEGLVAIQKKIDEDKVSLYKIYTDRTSIEQRMKMFD